MNKRLLLSSLAVISFLPLMAQNETTAADTLSANDKVVKNRNIMLNESSISQPRQISIGLPPTISSSIFEDGLPTAYYPWPYLPSFNWHSGNAEKNISVMSLGEAALRSGVVNYVIESDSRLPEMDAPFHSNVSLGVSHYGGFNTDLSAYGNISKNWGLMGSAFIVRDPGNNPAPDGLMQTSQEIFKIGAVHRWDEGRGKASVILNYSSYSDYANSFGVFNYHASSGTVTPYEGFNTGKDYFFPLLGNVPYVDVLSGEKKDKPIKDFIKSPSFSALARVTYSWPTMKLDVSAKFKTAESNYFTILGSGLSEVGYDAGYHYRDWGSASEYGQPFAGMTAGMLLVPNKGFSRDAMLTAELSGTLKGSHSWRIGLNEWWNHASNRSTNSSIMVTCEPEPKLLYANGGFFTNFNTIAEFYDGYENKLALYASDDWKISRKLAVSAGVRLQVKSLKGDNAIASDDTPQNERGEGWSLKTGVKTPFNKSFFECAAEGAVKYHIANNFGLTAEYLFNRNYITLEHYASSTLPTYDPFDLHLANGGIFWNTDWMELASKVFYVTQSNYQTSKNFFHPLTKPVGGLPEGYVDASYQTIQYGVQTFGWTTDVVFKPVKGLQIHALFTLQYPKYRNLVFTPEFKDGYKETFDMSGNTVTSVPKQIVELNPSYTYKRFNVWASIRYSGRRMVNMTNSLFHAGRWDSFGGVGFKVNDRLSLAVNLTNFLNQKGASGSIPSASLLRKEDVGEKYENIPVLGSFVRPFTAEFSVKLNL